MTSNDYATSYDVRNAQQPSPMAWRRYSPFTPVDLPDRTWPRQVHHQGPALVRGRPARRQPGADRPDDARRASCGCSSCWCGMGYKEIEVGFPSASQTDFDFVRAAHRGRPASPTTSTIQVLTQAREHLIERTFEAIARRAAGDRAPLQLDLDAAAPGRVRPRPRRHHGHRRRRRRAVPEVRREPCPGTEVCFEYSPGVVHRHRARVRRRGLRRGHRRLAADARPQDDRQPAGDRRDGHAQRLRRLDRVDAPQPRAPRLGRALAAPAQRPRHRASPPPSSATWPAPTASRAACSATASAPATSAW